MPRAAFLILVLGLTGSTPARAQSPLTIDEAVARAVELNPEVRAVQASEEEARARSSGARSGYLPRVDVMEGWQRGDQPVFVFGALLGQRQFTAADFALDSLNHPDALSNHRAAIVVEQTLFDGARTQSAVRSAVLGESAARLDVERTRADIRLAVVRAYGRALTARAMHESSRAAVAAAAEDLRRSMARRDAGLESEANVLSLQVREAEVESRRIRAESDERIARAALNSLIGAPLDDARPLVPMETAAPRDLDTAALENAALANRPEVRQLAVRRDQAAAARSMARAAFLPQVVVQGTAEANGGTFDDRAGAWTAGVLTRWNVFAGGADAARLRETAAALRRLDAERERLETNVRLEVRQAVAEYESARAREQSGRRMVDQARESQRMIRDRYDAGLASAGDLLRAAEAVAQSEALRTSATNDVAVTAAAIARAIGSTGSRP